MLGIFTLGFRHGFDMDHVAAITDITGSQVLRLRAFLLSTVYALGHAVMVVALGLGIAWAGWEVPDAGRVIGVTLVVLGSYVLWCVATNRRPSSRAGLITVVMRRARDQIRPTVTVEHDHDHAHGDGTSDHGHTHADLVATAAVDGPRLDPPSGASDPVPAHRQRHTHRHPHRHDDVPAPYGVFGAFSVGMIHGIGAETPTQILALAAGTVSLAPFLGGLFLGNTIVAAVAAIGLTERRLRVLNGFVGAFSLYVGIPYLLGVDPPLVW